MRMDNTSKDDSCMLNRNTEQLDSSCRGKGQASLRIQRCHSDGVLINGCLKSKAMSSACKSSSESSMEGRIDSVTTHSIGSMTTHSIGGMTTHNIGGMTTHSIGGATNGTAGSNHTCTGFDNDLSPVGENRESLTSNCAICDNNTPIVFQSTHSIDGYDVVRPKTWSRRVVEKRKDQMKSSKKKSKISENKNLEVRLNGLDIKTGLNAETTVYSRNVCDTYRQEADVIFGRTRGGTRRNIEPLVCELPRCLENGIDTPANKNPNKKQLIGNNAVIVDNVEIERLQDYNVEHQSFLAPLAMPEDFSDEEAAVGGANTTTCTSQITSNLSETATETKQGCAYAGSPSVVIVEKPSENGELTQNDEMKGQSLVAPSANSSQTTENVLNGAHCTNRVSHTFENNTHENSNKKNGYSSSDRDNVLRNYLPLQQNEIRPSRSSSLESIDDIGDFIEADLPPNVERLAFFSRGSSDEDEGCGDEMLPNDDGGEESENETIDPLVDYRRSELLMHNNTGNMIHNGLHQGLFDNSNLLSDPATVEVDNDSGDDIFSNVILNDDGEQSLYSASGCSTESRSEGNSANSKMNSNFNTMPRSRLDRNSGSSSLMEDSNCVCCDRQVDVRYQRTEELGVIVCDNCFNELDFVGNKKFDNVVRKKSRTLGAGSSLSASLNSHNKLVRKNNNFLLVSNNSQEKVNNNSVTSVRLSSNESESFERLYVSDSSEMVSPDGDTGAESVFQSSSATSSDGTFVQYMQMSLENSTTEEDTILSDVPSLHHQASSQDYKNVDEQLYCPYLTHRSRSLDHELAECDTPNISVTSSNFQEDESNNQEKVFEKHAYDVDVPIPTCSSSDEEENTRVPDSADETEVCASHISPHHESVDMERMLSRPTHVSRKVRGQSNDLDEEEPIYEDIDDLEVLLLEVSNDGEPDNRSHAQPLCNAISKLRRKRRRSPTSDIEKVMLWYEYEAYVVQVKQIGTSACGPTAVLNVLKAFDFQVEKDEVTQTITSNLRMEAAPIPYYLFSRYSAGTTAQTLVEGVAAVTRGAIKGRFFHFYPQRDVELLKWLGHWMKKGAVPVATLNLQKGVKPGWTIPDAWHHQMVYGVSSKGVYLTNPLEIVPEKVIMDQLSSDSVLLVRRQDVVSRFRDWCPLNETLKQRDPRWCTMNVLGQIVHMLREQCMPQDQLTCIRSQLTSHICIPAAYKAGIILFMRTNSDIYEELLKAPELPLKNAPSDM